MRIHDGFLESLSVGDLLFFYMMGSIRSLHRGSIRFL